MILKPFLFIRFFLFYLKEVIKTNLMVAYEVLTPTHYMEPGFVKIDTKDLSNRQLLVFCNLLTMTPGSLVADVAEDKSFVTVHILYLEDEAKVIKDIEDDYLKRVKELF